MIKRISSFVILGVFLFALLPVHAVSAQKIIPGSTCKVHKQKITNQNKVYTCIKSGKKLVWNKGFALNTTPTPLPTQKNENIPTYKVGDVTASGGTVFYVAKEEMEWGKYLEVAPDGWVYTLPDIQKPFNAQSISDPITSEGKCADIEVNFKTTSEIGAGKRNTELLAKSCKQNAIRLVQSYSGGGFTDWYLPSINELSELCKFARGQVTGDDSVVCSSSGRLNPRFSMQYASSTGVTQTTFYIMNFVTTAPTMEPPGPVVSQLGRAVVPIRAFTLSKTVGTKIQPTPSPYPKKPIFTSYSTSEPYMGMPVFNIDQATSTDPSLKMQLVRSPSKEFSSNSFVVCKGDYVVYGLSDLPNDINGFRQFPVSDPEPYSVGSLIRTLRGSPKPYFTCIARDSDSNYLGSVSVLASLFK